MPKKMVEIEYNVIVSAEMKDDNVSLSMSVSGVSNPGAGASTEEFSEADKAKVRDVLQEVSDPKVDDLIRQAQTSSQPQTEIAGQPQPPQTPPTPPQTEHTRFRR